ncbi:MAG: hypothetical protein R2787_04460 [Saprospiraceae bacterium]
MAIPCSSNDNVTVLEEEDLVAKDNCDDNVDVTFEEIILQGDCEQDGYYIFMHCIWTAVDDCGNQAVFEIYAKVSDTHPPMLMPLPKDVTISWGNGTLHPDGQGVKTTYRGYHRQFQSIHTPRELSTSVHHCPHLECRTMWQ